MVIRLVILFILSGLCALSFASKAELADSRACGALQIEVSLDCYSQAVSSFLGSWLKAWGKGDFNAYVAHYAPDVSPRSGMTRYQWEQNRKKMILEKSDILIDVDLESMMLKDNGETEIYFSQSYRSSTHKDYVRKKLVLIRNGDSFNILREQTVKTVVTP